MNDMKTTMIRGAASFGRSLADISKCLAGVAVLTGTALPLRAAPPPSYVIRNGNIYPADSDKTPAFRAVATPRAEYGTEHYIAVWGAANFLQTSDENKISGYGESLDLALKSDLSFAAGFKFGHIWNLNDSGGIAIHGEKKNVTILPSIEGEFIYAGNNGSKMQWDGAFRYGDYTVNKIYQKFDMDIYALMLNPIVRGQWGRFRPYVGFGVGGAYVTAQGRGIYADGTKHTTDGQGRPVNQPVSDQIERGGGNDSKFAFAFQGLAGTDIFLNQHWSLFMEYKFLGLVGLQFDAGGGYKYDMGDVYGNHLVGLGVKYHY
jgi:opacity protein-like surface antigen